MIATGMLMALVLLAAATDLLRHKVYNATTYPGMLLAFGVNLFGSLLESGWVWQLERTELARWREIVGWIGLPESAAGFSACGLLLVICFVFFNVGGGDVKLLAMIGAFLGLYQGIEVVLWSFVIGGAVALVTLVWRYGAWNLVRGLFRRARSALRSGSLRPLAEPSQNAEDDAPPALYLAPSALAAVVIVRFSLWELF